jgi:hypothetical protein
MGNWSNFSWLKWPNWLDKKNKQMEITEKNIHEARVFYSAFDFEWIKGENATMSEKFKDVTLNDDLMFVEFQSGKRINVELIPEFMLMLPSPPVQIQPIPIKPVETSGQNQGFAVTSIQYEDSKNANNESPIYKLLKKQKKNMVEISIKLKLNLPPRDLYGVLSGSFDEAEKEIIDFVLDGVDIDSIKSSLAESIKKTYYSEQSKLTEGQKKNQKKGTNGQVTG